MLYPRLRDLWVAQYVIRLTDVRSSWTRWSTQVVILAVATSLAFGVAQPPPTSPVSPDEPVRDPEIGSRNGLSARADRSSSPEPSAPPEDAPLSEQAIGPRPGEVRIGVTALWGHDRCLAMWSPLAAYLERMTGIPSVRIVPLGLSEGRRAAQAGAVDFVLTQPANYLMLEHELSMSKILTLRSRRPGEAATLFGGVIISRADRTDILTLADLRGKRFAAVSETAFGGWQMAWRELQAQGIDPLSDFADLIFTGLPQDRVVQAVVEGRVDAGTVRASTLERMVEDGLLDMSRLRILNERIEPHFPYRLSTRLYPEWTFAQVPSVDPDIARHVTAALLELERDDAAAIAANIAGFIPPLSHESVQNCLRELGVGPYARDSSQLLRDAVDANRFWLALVLMAGVMVVVTLFVVARISMRLRETRNRLWSELDGRYAVESQLKEMAIVASNTDNMVVVTSRDGLITWVNDALTQTSGYSIEEARGRYPSDLLGSPNADRATQAHIIECVQSGTGFNIETLNRKKSGEDYWVSLDVRPVHDTATNKLTGFVGVSRDITERRRFEEELRASREMLQTILDTVPQMIFWKDHESRYLGCNRAFLKVAGLDSMDQIVGLRDEDLPLGSNDAEGFRTVDRSVMQSEQPYWATLNYTLADGEECWVDQVKMPLHDGSGKVVGVMGFEENVTDRRTAIQRLRESERRYHELFEKLSDAAFVADPATGEIVDANARALQLVGAQLGEIIGLHQSMLHPEHLRDGAVRLFQHQAKSGEGTRVESLVVTRSGDLVPVEINASQIELNGRHLMVGLFRDISDRRAAEERVAARLCYEEALAECARTLVSAEDDQAISRSLEFVRAAFGVRNINFCKVDVGHQVSSAIWPAVCVCGASARCCQQMGEGRCLSYGDVYVRWQTRLNAGEPVTLRDMQIDAALPPEMVERGVASCVLVPIMIGTSVCALLAVEESSPDRAWSAEDLAMFRTAAEMVSAHIQRSEVTRALRLKQRHLDLALDAGSEGTWEWDIQAGEIELSRRWLQMVGYTVDLARTTFLDFCNLLLPGDRTIVRDQLDACRAGHASRCHVEARLITGTNQCCWVVIAGEVVERDEHGEPLRMVGVIRDVDETKQYEEEMQRYTEELVQVRDELESQTIALAAQTAELELARREAISASRAKSDFLANMSHEIRTPMTAVLGYTDLLLDAEGITEQQRTHIETIRRNGEHLLLVINDILDFSKIEAGKMSVDRMDVSPATALREVELLLRNGAADAGVALQIEIDADVPKVISSDPTRLRQILINLVNNAIKFSHRGGTVLARCQRVQVSGGASDVGTESEESLSIDFSPLTGTVTNGKANMVRFTVTDRGIGMSEDQVRRLFQPFEQGDSSTSRSYGGSGLGLAISHRLVDMLGGRIGVATRKNVGSTFVVDLPCPAESDSTSDGSGNGDLGPPAQAAGPGSAEDERAVPAVLSGRILLAEDGPDNRRLLEFMLRKAGLEVEVAVNGREAVEIALRERAAGRPYDLILMDMQMPELDGYGATRRLRKHGMTCPIVALTAHALTSDRTRCLDAGCDDYATKPINRRDLIAVVARHLAIAKARGAETDATQCSTADAGQAADAAA